MYRVTFIPQRISDRRTGVEVMERERENLEVDGKIFSHTFSDGTNFYGSVACYVPTKEQAHYMAFEIETRIPCRVNVE